MEAIVKTELDALGRTPAQITLDGLQLGEEINGTHGTGHHTTMAADALFSTYFNEMVSLGRLGL